MPTGPGRSTRHLATWAGDLSWQTGPEPPACLVPTGLPPADEAQLHRRFDAQGPGPITADGWLRVREAIEVCRGCPVVSECLAYALDPEHRSEGVWGGHYFPPPSATGIRDGRRVPVLPPPPGRRGRGRKVLVAS